MSDRFIPNQIQLIRIRPNQHGRLQLSKNSAGFVLYARQQTGENVTLRWRYSDPQELFASYGAYRTIEPYEEGGRTGLYLPREMDVYIAHDLDTNVVEVEVEEFLGM